MKFAAKYHGKNEVVKGLRDIGIGLKAQMGKEISAAMLTLSWDQRMDVAAALLENLRKPVGTLRRGGSA
jgi:hypothetical protein